MTVESEKARFTDPQIANIPKKTSFMRDLVDWAYNQECLQDERVEVLLGDKLWTIADMYILSEDDIKSALSGVNFCNPQASAPSPGKNNTR